MIKTEEIYVYLFDEGIDVWRPVDAIKIEEGLYKIVSTRNSNETETLEFNIGDTVKTIDKFLVGGSSGRINRKVAISKIN